MPAQRHVQTGAFFQRKSVRIARTLIFVFPRKIPAFFAIFRRGPARACDRRQLRLSAAGLLFFNAGLLLAVVCYNRSLIFGLDEGNDLIRMKNLGQSNDLVKGLIALRNSDDVNILLDGVTVSGLNSERVG